MTGKARKESRPSDEGIVVLGIYHQEGRFEGAPNKDALIEAGNTIMVYGNEEPVNRLGACNPNSKETLDKTDERAEEVE